MAYPHQTSSAEEAEHDDLVCCHLSVVATIPSVAEVVPLVAGGGNVHGYRIKPDDIKKAMSLDALVVNGVGHDEFAFSD